MTRAPAAAEEPATRRLVAEMFLKAAGPALVKNVAEILQPHRIPVMPLKGVLLQRLVYRGESFRPIVDVDLLVPGARFFDAYAELRRAGFTEESWELGHWQVTLRNPAGPPLGVDLHRRLARTSRAGLTPTGMFDRGATDTQLFGAPVVLPCPDDLFAHLLLHATLHWINLGRLHRARDFEAVARATALDVDRCAKHVADQGLLTHAVLMLPLIRAESGGPFVDALSARLEALSVRLPGMARRRAAAWLVRELADRFEVGHAARRLAGLALAPSIPSSLLSAALDRLDLGRGGWDRSNKPFFPEIF